jgi:hypothetical protein
MFGSVQNIFRVPVKSSLMKLFVLFPNKEGKRELQLALEANDRDSLKRLAHDLAKLTVTDPSSSWRAASDGSEELLIEGQRVFLIKT